MSTSKQTKLSPKAVLTVALAAAVILVSGFFLFRSAFSGNVLASLDSGEFRFDLCGRGALSEIEVYRKGEKTATVKTSSVTVEGTSYGVTVTDLNFDGFPDLLVAQETFGEDVAYAAWTWNDMTSTYRGEEALSGARNLTVDERYCALVSHTEEYRFAGEDEDGKFYEDAEVYRIYREIDGKTVEFARYEFIHYIKNDVHAFQIFRYDEKKGEMRRFSEDEWLTAEEAASFSLLAAMERDLADHRADYFPAPEAEEGTEAENGDAS